MRSKGYNILEMDPLGNDFPGYEKLKTIKKNALVFITSFHPLIDTENLKRAKGHAVKCVAPLEIMDYLKPIGSVFYPHDLALFFANHEMPWCNLFDLFLLPYKNNLYFRLKSESCKVFDVGWIKNNSFNEKINIEHDIIYFPSNASCGIDKSGRIRWFSYIPKDVPIKIKVESSLTASGIKTNDPIELAKQDGYNFIDSSLNIFQLIHNCRLIITNGASSVVTEAAMSGVPVATILDGIEPDESYLRQLPKLDWVFPLRPSEVKDFITDVRGGGGIIEKGPNLLKQFDFEKAVDAITSLIK